MKLLDFFGVDIRYDKMGQHIWAVEKDGNHRHLATIRGWGAIQHLFEPKDGVDGLKQAEKFQDEMGEFIAEAIREKIEREKNKQ